MNSTKLKILEAARQLFNKEGYSNVTLRMIALELKMSVGNLNYHFNKKETLLEALYFEMVSEFDKRISELGSTPITLKSVKTDILQSMERMVAYSFFWTDLYFLLKLNPKITAHFNKAYQDRCKGTQLLFKILQENKILKPFQFNKEPILLIERLIAFSNTWLYNSSLYEQQINNLDPKVQDTPPKIFLDFEIGLEEINKTFIDQQANQWLTMLYPYFTDLGKTEYKNLLPKYF